MKQLEAGIRQEYAKNYIWTGDINEDLYEVGLIERAVQFLGSLLCGSLSPANAQYLSSSGATLKTSPERSLRQARHHGLFRLSLCLFGPASTLQEDCSFTDPTLSFSGLSAYKRNVGSLQGVLDRLVSNSRSVLYSCELRQVKNKTKAPP